MHQKITTILFYLSLVTIVGSCAKQPTPEPPGEVYDPTFIEIDIPPGFPNMPIPLDNPMTAEGVALGRQLFYDFILSGNGTQSCGSCHSPTHSFTDNGSRFSEGIDGFTGTRNAQAIINIGWMPSLFWDGRAESVEIQALEPVTNPIEMHESWQDAATKLNDHPTYPDLFFKAFGTKNIDSTLVVKAIAQFERTLVSADSKWDRYLRGEVQLSQAETQGFEIFFTEKGDCFHCHTTILFTDNLPHNNGLDALATDSGFAAITGNPNDLGKFKTPTLRNLVFTAPYMHDGRFETIEQVIDFYSDSVKWSPTIDPLMKQVNQGGIRLTTQEKQSLIAFVKTLTDTNFVNNPAHANPLRQ